MMRSCSHFVYIVSCLLQCDMYRGFSLNKTLECRGFLRVTFILKYSLPRVKHTKNFNMNDITKPTKKPPKSNPN